MSLKLNFYSLTFKLELQLHILFTISLQIQEIQELY